MATAAASLSTPASRIFSLSSLSLRLRSLTSAAHSLSRSTTTSKKKKQQQQKQKQRVAVKEKRRTRSDREFDINRYGDSAFHIPVLLGEVIDVFPPSKPLRRFVDCTVGAAGHSSAIIEGHPEMEVYVGLDVDPVALDKARARINSVLNDPSSTLKAYTFLENFRYIKSLLTDVDETLLDTGIDGILMDLGMSSMQVNDPQRGFSVLANGPLDMRMDPQASLKAEDILNSWPETEVGRILRDYGEESNWYSLQNKIVKARLQGGLHSTGELVDLIKSATPLSREGRQGWIKTATRVFQALRIAVNDELKTLEDSLYSCFDCLAPGGRLAVISFHSLEDRIVKQTFLDIINIKGGDGDAYMIEERERKQDLRKIRIDIDEDEMWVKQMLQGLRGTILTKRPITPSEEEEKLNTRCRSAKLRVIQKV
ncbi:ribosomal RNA small subunit methyltransferase H [Rosa sericea]